MSSGWKTENPRRAIFNGLARSWDSMVMLTPDQSRTLGRVIASLSLTEDAAVLDVGCGTGVLVPPVLPFLGSDGRYIGIDVSDAMVAEARRKFDDRRVRFIAGDIYASPPLPLPFDAVVVFSAFPHLHDKPAALVIFRRLLKTGGKLCIAHVESSESINAYHRTSVQDAVLRDDSLPTLAEMRAMVDPALWREAEAQDREGLYLFTLERR